MTARDPRPDPKLMTDEDLLVEMGVAMGSLTALEMSLARGTVRPEAKADVNRGCREWARRVDRIEEELERRGFSIVVRGSLGYALDHLQETHGPPEPFERASE